MIGAQARQFLDRYAASEYAILLRRAPLLEKYLQKLLAPGNFDIHAVNARAKHPDSVRAKIMAKSYGHPAMQMVDQLAARVIVYYAPDVDKIAADLRPLLDIDQRHSSDKRAALGLREFGYRSVHLVAKPVPSSLGLEFGELDGQRFEVQIRSILEHAWAEIEHEVVYKAGLGADDERRRRFSAVAGTLELLEGEFGALREYRNLLIKERAKHVALGTEGDQPLDSAWLLAVLEVLRPDGLSWRASEDAGRGFPPRIETQCAEALRRIGVGTTSSLRRELAEPAVAATLARYAVATGAVPSQLSHLVVAVLLVASRNEETAADYFPQMMADPAMRAALTG